ncbi:hypothetical protein [Dietzia psychralcaliphila]|uniref:hypothetical protein n=1 Tax=Dietzia psychralcaliphila TaxID=139021 RepID=UPI001C1DE5A6|nr:hypothetical protein [Dietzia psychralcaliphila]
MKTGTRLVSQACETEVVVIRASVNLECGGAPMVENRDAVHAVLAVGYDEGMLQGGRYLHEESGLQLLCVTSGAGSLSVDGQALQEMAAKQLPSSD